MDPILAEWTLDAVAEGTTLVLPDGCVDLVVLRRPGDAVTLHASPLMDGPVPVSIRAGDAYRGFRLPPGLRLDAAALAALAAQAMARDIDDAAIRARLPDLVTRSEATRDALACLAQASSAGAAARTLGVSLRTLERRLRAETGRSPDFWRRLVRVRRAARAIASGTSPAEAAHLHAFTDQPHLTREVRRWFGTTPARLRTDSARLAMLDGAGYD